MKTSGPAVMATAVDAEDPLRGLTVAAAPPLDVRTGDEVFEVAAAALNHHDLWTLRGIGAVRVTLPRVLGSDGANENVVLWPALPCGDPAVCRCCRIGRTVLCRRLTMLGEGRDGTMAPRVAVPRGHAVAKPRNLSPVEAACLPSAYLTAYSMLFRAVDLAPGARVLVTGATGGMGVAALQIGAAAGFHMIALVRRPETASELQALGAAEVTSGLGGLDAEVDCVIESVGRATWDLSLRSLRPGGTVVVGGATSGDPPAGLRRIFWRQLRVVGVSLGSLDDLRALVRFVEDHDVRPRVAAVYPVERAREAFGRFASGGVLGKVVLTR